MMCNLVKIFNILVIFECVGIFVGSEVPRPRGVSLTRSSLYAPGEKFTCLDGLRDIKYEQINDDFCDCEDGSDEPGTSACPNGIFHCTNAGHRPQNIPSSRVNDHICDCCDGSDEYATDVKCVNNCSELGREEKHRQKARSELLKQGNQVRAELSLRGKAMKDEQRVRLEELKKSIATAEALKVERETIKKEAEALETAALDVYRDAQEKELAEKQELEAQENRKEAQITFTKYDSNADGLIEISEIQARVAFDQNRDGEVTIEEAKYFLDEHDQIDLETFITLAWPRIKPYLMLDSGLFKPPASVDELKETVDKTTEQDMDLEQAELLEPIGEGEDEHDENYEEEEETGEGEIEQVEHNLEPEYDTETQQLIEQANEARNQHAIAERELRELESEQRQIQSLLEKDFGPNEEFAPLNGECINFDDREYVYKLCPFDKAIQQPRSGGAETRLGKDTLFLYRQIINLPNTIFFFYRNMG